MTTLEERVSRLEAGYDHLATKADLYRLETRLLKWMIGTVLLGVSAAAALTLVIDRLIS